MDKQDFANLVSEALLDLPQKIQAKMNNVAVVVEDAPTADQLKKGGTRRGMLLLGLYEGVPQTKRGLGYTLVLPDKISIFQRSIEVIARTPDDIRTVVRQTVWHEFAHHFGFSEEGVQTLAKKRRQRKA